MVYNKYMFKNLENFVINDAVPERMLGYIYDQVAQASPESAHIMKELGHTTYFINFNDGFKQVMHSRIQPYFDEELEITEMAFARYHHESGYIPKLFPHFDHFKEHRITFDLQLDATIDWPIVIEGKEFLLKKNDALIFSGTDQIHWRKNVQLSPEDHVDMFFVHLSLVNNKKEISEEEKADRKTRLELFSQQVDIAQPPIKSGE